MLRITKNIIVSYSNKFLEIQNILKIDCPYRAELANNTPQSILHPATQILDNTPAQKMSPAAPRKKGDRETNLWSRE